MSEHTHEYQAPRAVQADFNQAQSVIDDLTEQLIVKTKELAFARTSVKERDAFIAANAHLLGMEVGEDGMARFPQEQLAPVPLNREARRATAKPRTPRAEK